MQAIEIKPGIYYVGVNDEKTELFEGLWPIKQEGISYNSFLIQDEKNVLIDLCKDSTGDDYLAHLKKIIDPAKIDYVVINHMEPDHTGAIEQLRALNPQVTLLASEKARAMLTNFYGITDPVQMVSEGETLRLGKHTLLFFSTPNVHWPETIMTYETSQKVLFSCDGFGGYGRLDKGIFDDDCGKVEWYEQEAMRYFANIVVSFSKPTLMAIAKLAKVEIDMVAPSHGLVWRKNPTRIIQLYEKWCKYREQPDTGITFLVGSMYGNTEKMAAAVEAGVLESGVACQRFDITNTHVSYILPSLMAYREVLIGVPTYEGRIFPPINQVLEMAGIKHLGTKKVAYFGSYGWGGGAVRSLGEKLAELKWELVESLDFPGKPSQELLNRGNEMGNKFGRLVSSQ